MYCIALSIASFIIKEAVVLYYARTKRLGILLESAEARFYPNELPAIVRIMDMLLIVITSMSLLIYLFFLYNKLVYADAVHELQFIDVGAMILLYILLPSRRIFCLLNESGIIKRSQQTDWQLIDYASIEREPSVRRMFLVQLSCGEGTIEAYLYERDIPSFTGLLAAHSIRLSEK